jgi:hypothetical protein
MSNKIEELNELSVNELKETTGGFMWAIFAVGVLYGILSSSWGNN